MIIKSFPSILLFTVYTYYCSIAKKARQNVIVGILSKQPGISYIR